MTHSITVIGYKGVVGNATYSLFKRLGYDVNGIDIKDSSHNDPILGEILFICIPESGVTSKNLRKYITTRTQLFVIRSTVLPSTCELLQSELGIHVAHNPEFLREASSVIDSFSPERVLIGYCCEKHAQWIQDLYNPLCRPVYLAARRVTELTKLACNGWLANVISYWNTIDRIAQEYGLSGTEVGMLASTDPRIGDYGSRFHNKFGGKCLPKDLNHLISIAQLLGLDTECSCLKAIAEVNNTAEEINCEVL